MTRSSWQSLAMAPSTWDTPQTRKDDLTNQIKDRLANRLDKTVYVKSDARAKYGDVVAVVDEIRSAGVDQVGLLTEKNQKADRRPRHLDTSRNPTGD